MTVLASSFGNGDVFIWMVEFFLFVIWFWLLLTVFSDIFRDHELGGGMKTLWIIFVIVLPFLGVFIYLIARGKSMAARQAAQIEQMQQQTDARIRAAAGTGATPADQITQAKALLDSGAIDQAEYESLKAKALAH